MVLPCGQCIGCRLDRSRDWAARVMHESQLYENSLFVTLTYSEEALESLRAERSNTGSLWYPDFQRFMKRLRRSEGPVRFFMCGEYGEQFLRPHFHACLFGCFFPDREYHKTLGSGYKIYTSKKLSALWPHGFATIGDVTFESAAYVARYAAKSELRGHDGKRRRVVGVSGFVDEDTGEFIPALPEFTRMSLKPGIGAKWFSKYHAEVLVRDKVVLGGREGPVPRYYDKIVEAADAYAAEYRDFLRLTKAEELCYDNLPERLKVREVVAKARLAFKKRELG